MSQGKIKREDPDGDHAMGGQRDASPATSAADSDGGATSMDGRSHVRQISNSSCSSGVHGTDDESDFSGDRNDLGVGLGAQDDSDLPPLQTSSATSPVPLSPPPVDVGDGTMAHAHSAYNLYQQQLLLQSNSTATTPSHSAAAIAAASAALAVDSVPSSPPPLLPTNVVPLGTLVCNHPIMRAIDVKNITSSRLRLRLSTSLEPNRFDSTPAPAAATPGSGKAPPPTPAFAAEELVVYVKNGAIFAAAGMELGADRDAQTAVTSVPGSGRRQSISMSQRNSTALADANAASATSSSSTAFVAGPTSATTTAGGNVFSFSRAASPVQHMVDSPSRLPVASPPHSSKLSSVGSPSVRKPSAVGISHNNPHSSSALALNSQLQLDQARTVAWQQIVTATSLDAAQPVRLRWACRMLAKQPIETGDVEAEEEWLSDAHLQPFGLSFARLTIAPGSAHACRLDLDPSFPSGSRSHLPFVLRAYHIRGGEKDEEGDATVQQLRAAGRLATHAEVRISINEGLAAASAITPAASAASPVSSGALMAARARSPVPLDPSDATRTVADASASALSLPSSAFVRHTPNPLLIAGRTPGSAAGGGGITPVPGLATASCMSLAHPTAGTPDTSGTTTVSNAAAAAAFDAAPEAQSRRAPQS